MEYHYIDTFNMCIYIYMYEGIIMIVGDEVDVKSSRCRFWGVCDHTYIYIYIYNYLYIYICGGEDSHFILALCDCSPDGCSMYRQAARDRDLFWCKFYREFHEMSYLK